MKLRRATFAVLTVMSLAALPLMAQQVASHDEHGGGTNPSADVTLERKITVDLVHVTLDRALQLVASQARAAILYHSELVGRDPRPLTLHAKEMSLRSVFDHLFTGTTLQIIVLSPSKFVVVDAVMNADTLSADSTGVISGIVLDSATKRPVAHASVRVTGTKTATTSSDSGYFTLRNVPVGTHTLSVKLFGYRAAEQSVTVVTGAPVTVHIMMPPIPRFLSGVVTTATGREERFKVGNDITVLSADSIMKVAPVSTLTDLLEARVPGMIVQRTSGIPGAPSRLRIRGLSSINQSADPILIVDGIRRYADQSGSIVAQDYGQNGSDAQNPASKSGGGTSMSTLAGPSQESGYQFAGPSALDQIDPNSIETIEVLKGPSATAIYGSDAANGVIVITTKHGVAGPTHWTLTADAGRTSLPGAWPENYYLFCEANRMSLPCDESNVVNGNGQVDSIVRFQALNNPRYSPLTGQPGQNHDASLTVSGGSGRVTYSVTGAASHQSGYLHLPAIELQRFQIFHGFPAPQWMRTPDQYGTYSIGSNLSFDMGRNGAQLTLSNSLFRNAQQQSSLQSDVSYLSSMYVDTTQLAQQPLFTDYYTRARSNNTTFSTAASLSQYIPWQWLPLNGTAGLSVITSDNNTLLPRDYITCLGNVYDGNCGNDSLGAYGISQGTNTSMTFTVGTKLLRQQPISTDVGINVNTTTQSGFSASTKGLPIGVSIPSQFVYADGDGPSYSTYSSSTYGWYVQPMLNLNSRFFVSPGFRLDGGSASGARGGVNAGALSLFPKLDFSWIAVSRPPSAPMFGALTLLRPRLAFGIAGVQPNAVEKLRILSATQAQPVVTGANASTSVDVLQVASLGNTQLHPERDRELEGGFDAELWNDRLRLTLTGYHKMAYDAILAIPIAPSVLASGTSATIDKNFGTIRNTGLEADIEARLLDSRLVDWSVVAMMSKNRNLLVTLFPGQPAVALSDNAGTGVTTRLTPGYPLFGLWAQPIIGFADVNHDGHIESNELSIGDSAVYIGAPEPNYQLSLSTTFAFFNSQLNINTAAVYQNGLTQMNYGKSLNTTSGVISNVLLQLEYNDPTATLPQQAATIAALCPQGNACSGIGLLQTVNTLRWNTLSISYLMPQRISRVLRVPSLSVALQGNNLGLHTNYHGKDPGVNSFSSGNMTSNDGSALPQPRVWSLRISINN